MTRELRNDVRGCAEAMDAEPLAVAGHSQRAIADEAGAQPRRHFHSGAVGGQCEAIAAVRERVLRVTAVDRVAGESREIAEVFTSAHAIRACAARVAQPRNAHACANAE